MPAIEMDADDRRRFYLLHDVARMTYTVMLACRTCGHARIYDGYAIWWLFERRGWDDRLPEVPKHFYCLPCLLKTRRKVRGPKLTITTDEPTDTTLARPDELRWRKAVKGRR